MKPVIEINQLGKKYRIRKTEPYVALRDAIAGSFRNMFRARSENKTDFWALQDINLSIGKGERVGIIGRNGAGKSTLLKILSRITWPTTGEAIIRGRLASLLEVGTGFHPELTGRENIFLNGSILGLKRTEIQRQFDAIVEFSGVSAFLDTPLKNYSSGMQLRLAFAVAAHLEPEVLLIDEVLAVGDMEFQKKCIGKMEEVSREHGRTILFVSHNLNYISSLCTKSVLLDHGNLVMYSKTGDVINKYISAVANRSSFYTWDDEKMPGNEIVRLKSMRIVDSTLETKSSFSATEPVGIEMNYEVSQNGHVLWLGHNIHNQDGVNVFDTHSVNTEYYKMQHPRGSYSSIVWIPANLLNSGTYYVSSAIFNHLHNTVHLHELQIVLFTIHEDIHDNTSRGLSGGEFPGIVRPFLPWTIKQR